MLATVSSAVDKFINHILSDLSTLVNTGETIVVKRKSQQGKINL